MPRVMARSGNAPGIQMVPQARRGLLCQHRTREDPMAHFLPGFTPPFPLGFTPRRSVGGAGGTLNTSRVVISNTQILGHQFLTAWSPCMVTSHCCPPRPGPRFRRNGRRHGKNGKPQEKCFSGTFTNALNIFLRGLSGSLSTWGDLRILLMQSTEGSLLPPAGFPRLTAVLQEI